MLNPNPCKHAVAAWAFACFLLGLPTAGWNVPSGTVICKPKKINCIIHCYKICSCIWHACNSKETC